MTLKKPLKNILAENEPEQNLRYEVAKHILEDCETDEEIKTFFDDLLRYGCASGMVSSLIYYADTHAFYERHYDEIEELREEIEESIGEPLKIKYDLKNFFAWLAFEETARKIAEELLPGQW